MALVRRFLVQLALIVWVGGFTFYGGVVVPFGRHEFGSGFARVTRPVTLALNLAGAVAMLPCIWDILRCGDESVRRQGVRWLAWAGMALTLAVLFWLHRILSLHLLAGLPSSDPVFRAVHRGYLVVGTLQWLCSLVYLGASLGAWRAEDRAAGKVTGSAAQNLTSKVTRG
jgi:hypothetical protein